MTEPDYDYSKLIKKPNEIGVSSGTDRVIEDVEALTKYIELLAGDDETGDDSASKLKDGQTIGDSYFMKSNIKCTSESGEEVDRYFYVDNRTDSSTFLLSTIESIGQIPLEMVKMFTIFAEIGPQKCTNKQKKIVSQNIDGTQTESNRSRNTHIMEGFSIFKKSFKDKVPHFYVLTVGLFFTYVLFNLSLKKK